MMKWQGLLSIKSIQNSFKSERENIMKELVLTCYKNK